MIPSVVIKGFLRWQRGYNIFAEAKPEIPSRHRQLTWPIRTQDLFHLAHMQNLRIIIFYTHLVLVLTMSILGRVGGAL